MKTGSMIIKIKLLIVLFAVLMSNQILANDIDINDMTLKEAIEYSQSGNPIDAVLDYCKENNLYGAETFAEEFGDGEWGDVELGSETKIKKTISDGVEALEGKHKNQQKEDIFIELKSHIFVYILLIIFIVLLTISIVKKKKVLIILCSIVFVVVAVFAISIFLKVNKRNDLYDDTLKLLNNINDKKAEESLNLDKEINISAIINDYIIKVWYCAKCKAENIDIFDNDMVNGNHTMDEPIIFYDDYIDVDKNYVSKSEYYGKRIVSDWTGRDYPIQTAGISKETTKGIYDNLTDKDIEDYKNKTLINKLVVELKNRIKYREHTDKMFEREPLSDYIAIIAQGSSCYFSKDIDNEVKSNYKYWYLDGENKIIELPYGVYLKYEKQEVEKIDNAEWIYTNINEIDYTNDDDFLYAYYIKDGKLYGEYAAIDNENEKISFNPYELTHKIKKAKVSLSLDKDYKFNDKNPLKESEKKWYIPNEITKEFEENGRKVIKSCGTSRDNQLIFYYMYYHKLYEKCNYTDKFIENKENILNKFNYNFGDSNRYIRVYVENDIIKPDKMLRKLEYNDGTGIYFIVNVIWIEGAVDDIDIYEVPKEYNNLSPEEIYQLAFND